MTLLCRDEHRRQLIRDEHRREPIHDASLNGVDYIDVHDKHLCVHFLTGIPPEFLPAEGNKQLTPEEKARALRRIVIRGGRRITDIHAIGFDTDRASNRFEESCLGIDVDKEGDWSEYTVCFVELDDEGRPTDKPLRSLDPRYACLGFAFRTDCPAETDCKSDEACPPEVRPEPAISYLAKDYASFRQLILDRLSLVMPDWRERHVPDVGVTLVEVLAYTADYLSYYQDSVGTEQYLDTARQRISVRRHARLIDYVMHDGCNARVFVYVRTNGEKVELAPRDFFFLTRPPGPDVPPVLDKGAFQKLPPGALTFEPLVESPSPACGRLPEQAERGDFVIFRRAHNTIRIYTWGNAECCLPRGATRATLLDETEEHDKQNAALCEEKKPKPKKPHKSYDIYKAPKPKKSKKTKHAKSYEEEEHEHEHDHEHYDGCGCPPPPPPPPPPRPLQLCVGDFLLFEELACAGTVRGDFDGETPEPDADRTHRHVVRLTKVTEGCDALLGNRVLDVEWSREDALPFALCVSAIGAAPDCDYVTNLAVARGNIVLADHGRTIPDEPLEPVPAQPLLESCDGVDAPAEVAHVAGRYRPVLDQGPLTFAEPLRRGASASALLLQNPRSALPAVEARSIPPSVVTDDDGRPLALFRAEDFRTLPFLASSLKKPKPEQYRLIALRQRLRADLVKLLDEAESPGNDLIEKLDANLRALTERWSPRADLLASSGEDAHFVAEVDDAGLAHLRFGDGDTGRAVEMGMEFIATYRAGNGRAGLVGPESIVHAVVLSGATGDIERVRNPLAARGAVDPESIAAVKAFAPSTIRGQLQRAVTADDYAALARSLRYPDRDPRVQAASGRLLWNGSWYEADVSIDPFATPALEAPLQQEITARLQPHRRMGHDLRVGGADIVPIRVELELCVEPDYLRAHVVPAVRAALAVFFHPDNLSFGGAVHVSSVIAAVMAVDGVATVCVTKLERLDQEGRGNPDLAKGLLKLRPNEIARLDADASLPENGILSFSKVRGGR